jgi:pyruvate/2-oxoglutarate dehydrogenase complex dihydrolipoamide dehydrogenase (E3) component
MYNFCTEHKPKNVIKLVCKADDKKVLGLHIYGKNTSEMLVSLIFLKKSKDLL